ncbi:MAG: DUF1554 domain-containing protein [Polyangiaceae bacterium]
MRLTILSVSVAMFVSGLVACGETLTGEDAPPDADADAATNTDAAAAADDASTSMDVQTEPAEAASGDASSVLADADAATPSADADAGPTVDSSPGADASDASDAGPPADAAPASFKIHGTISGVTVTGVVLRNNGADDLSVAANATTFEFSVPVLDGAPFNVAVYAVPASPLLVCTVTNGKGFAGPSMADISIACEKGHRIFLTSTVYDGNLGGLAGADAKCQARADAASLGGTWKAILSTRTVDARDHVDGTVPRYNVDGTRVMKANEMFSTSATTGTYPLLTPIRDEFGHAVVGNLFPFAGGGPDGRHAEPSAPYGLGWDDACEDWTSTKGTTTCGYNNTTSGTWLSGCGGIDCKGYVSGVGIHCAED